MDYIGYSNTKDIYMVKIYVREEPTRKFNRLFVCFAVIRS